MGNRSLDEFLTNEPTDPDSDTSGATPAAPTMVWTPDGAVCENCGETVQRRWRERSEQDGADGRLVCEACKPWK